MDLDFFDFGQNLAGILLSMPWKSARYAPPSDHAEVFQILSGDAAAPV